MSSLVVVHLNNDSATVYSETQIARPRNARTSCWRSNHVVQIYVLDPNEDGNSKQYLVAREPNLFNYELPPASLVYEASNPEL